MYMRLFQSNVKPDAVERLIEYYTNKVIPALQNVKGCRSAKLIRNSQKPETFISMTLWEEKPDSENYEKSDLFKQFMKELEPFFSDTSEWKVHLSENQELTYGPVREEPVINSYSIKTKIDMNDPTKFKTDQMCIRMVAHKVKKDKIEEFNKIYQQEIIPALQNTEGCFYAYLTENTGGSDMETEEVISVTIWESQERAEQYAKSGLFDQLIQKLQHTFSQLSQWNLSLNNDKSKKVKTSDDIVINRYSVITEKKFE